MSIRNRIALGVSATFVVLAMIGYVVQRKVIYARFVDLERSKATDDFQRCTNAVARELTELTQLVGDWSGWDDTYQYLEDRNEAYETSNLSDATFENNRMSMYCIVRTDGTVARFSAKKVAGERLNFAEIPHDRFPLDHPLLAHKNTTERISGILRTSHGPLLIASAPVVKPDRSGSARGWIMFGKVFDSDLVADLRSRALVEFQVSDLGGPLRDHYCENALSIVGTVPTIEDTRSDLMIVHGTMPGLDGQPVVHVCARVPRSISIKGRQAATWSTSLWLSSGLLTVSLLAKLLTRTVARPLQQLADHAEMVGKTSNLAARSGIVRSDEIGTLARTFDEMVTQLAQSRSQLSETARLVGMADVARGIVHNVGNVLNNVTVSTDTIAETVRQLQVANLGRAVELIEQNQEDLGRFVREDQRGRHLPRFLGEVFRVMKHDQNALLQELDRLRESLNHVLQLFQSQNALATTKVRAEEMVTPSALLNQALALVNAGLKRHAVEVTCEIEDGDPFLLDRTKALEILVNLLTNAKEALGRRQSGRQITVRSTRTADTVSISISDNGMGIAGDDLTRIFQMGYTTKSGGHGIGLHFCGVAAMELGGKLRAESSGPGLGACFTLDLPAPRPAEVLAHA